MSLRSQRVNSFFYSHNFIFLHNIFFFSQNIFSYKTFNNYFFLKKFYFYLTNFVFHLSYFLIFQGDYYLHIHIVEAIQTRQDGSYSKLNSDLGHHFFVVKTHSKTIFIIDIFSKIEFQVGKNEVSFSRNFEKIGKS